MEILELLNWLFDKFGAAALPYTVIAFLVWLVVRDRNSSRSQVVPKEYQEIIAAYHAAVTENTRVTERLAILIEERTRARNRSQ